MKKNVWNKKASELTVAESLKLSGIITLVTTALCCAPLAWEYRDEIKEKFIRKKANS